MVLRPFVFNVNILDFQKKNLDLNEYSSIFVAYTNSRNAQGNCYDEYAQCVRFQYKLFIRISTMTEFADDCFFFIA